MRIAPGTIILTLAAATVLAGSCAWAWQTDEYWKALPLYPCAAAAGILATVAIYRHSRRFSKASWMGAGVSVMTMGSTAVITLFRWGF